MGWSLGLDLTRSRDNKFMFGNISTDITSLQAIEWAGLKSRRQKYGLVCSFFLLASATNKLVFEARQCPKLQRGAPCYFALLLLTKVRSTLHRGAKENDPSAA